MRIYWLCESGILCSWAPKEYFQKVSGSLISNFSSLGQSSFKMDQVKVELFCGQTTRNLKCFLKNMSSGLIRRGAILLSISTCLKSLLVWWYCMGNHHQLPLKLTAWIFGKKPSKLKGFRATYVLIQMMHFSLKVLRISARQC